MTSRFLRAAMFLCAILSTSGFAADYPERPVRLIVPVAAGGGSDILARALADRLSQKWSQKVLVDNRPGAGHIVGTAAGAKAEPDGYTVNMVGLPHVVNPSLNDHLPYKSSDFDPVILIAQVPIVLVVHPSTPFHTVADLVAQARRKPGQISFASTGQAGSGQLAGELLKLSAKIDMVHVPYKGSSAALQDVLAGRVPVMFDALVTAAPHIESGKLRPLAVTVAKRATSFPDVPTMEESGFPGFFVSGWLGLVVPHGTPTPIVERLNADVAGVVQQAEVVTLLHKQAWELLPIGPSREAFASFLQTEQAKWQKVIKAAGVKTE